MFGIDGIDLIIILVLAVVMFGPERLPEYSRKAARVFVYLRGIANNAKSTLATELGPEYADLELKDLNPKAFIAKHMREEVAMLEDAKREVTEATQLAKDSAKEAEVAAKLGVSATAVAGVHQTPFDPEST